MGVLSCGWSTGNVYRGLKVRGELLGPMVQLSGASAVTAIDKVFGVQLCSPPGVLQLVHLVNQHVTCPVLLSDPYRTGGETQSSLLGGLNCVSSALPTGVYKVQINTKPLLSHRVGGTCPKVT